MDSATDDSSAPGRRKADLPPEDLQELELKVQLMSGEPLASMMAHSSWTVAHLKAKLRCQLEKGKVVGSLLWNEAELQDDQTLAGLNLRGPTVFAAVLGDATEARLRRLHRRFCACFGESQLQPPCLGVSMPAEIDQYVRKHAAEYRKALIDAGVDAESVIGEDRIGELQFPDEVKGLFGIASTWGFGVLKKVPCVRDFDDWILPDFFQIGIDSFYTAMQLEEAEECGDAPEDTEGDLPYYYRPEWILFGMHDLYDRTLICCDPKSSMFGAVVGHFHRDGPNNKIQIPPGPPDGPGRPLLRFIEMVVSHCEVKFSFKECHDGFGFHHIKGDDDQQILLKQIKEVLHSETFDDPYPNWPTPVVTARDS